MNGHLASLRPRFGLIALAVLALFSAAAVKPAMAEDAEWRPGVYMSQAVARVMAGTKSITDISEYGWAPRTCFLASFLQVRGSSAMEFTFSAGTKYVFLAGGDDGAQDVDLSITDEDNRVVAKDEDTDPSAVVQFTPRRDGKYTLKLTLYAAKRGCFCAVAILQSGGYDVPVKNLSDATARLIGSCSAIWKKTEKAISFHDADNQWAIYGTMLKQEEDNTITNLHPGTGDVVFVSSADDNGQDIDLYLLDEDSEVLKKDTDPDATPVIVYHTRAKSSYGLKTACVKSYRRGATLVLTAALDIQ